MTAFPRPCLVCGKRVESGDSRCTAHADQRYKQPLACYVCGRRGPKGYCPEHNPYANQDEEQRLKHQPWRAGYRTAGYRTSKKIVLARAGGRCEKCGRADLSLEVDHIRPLSTATNSLDFPALNNISNLIVLCITCHRAKTGNRA